jgi:hypothetical protein
MEGGWAAAAQFQQPVAWDLSTPCVGVDTRQGDAKQFGGDGGGGRLQTFGAGSAERPVRDQVLSYVTIASHVSARSFGVDAFCCNDGCLFPLV